jgi:hypothetical protein
VNLQTRRPLYWMNFAEFVLGDFSHGLDPERKSESGK